MSDEEKQGLELLSDKELAQIISESLTGNETFAENKEAQAAFWELKKRTPE